MLVVIYTTLPDVGGHSTIVWELILSLLKSRAKVVILVRRPAGHSYSESTHQALAALGAELVRLDGTSRIEAMRKVIGVLRRRNISAFMSVGMRYLSVPLALIARTKNTIYYHMTHESGALGLKLLQVLHPFYRIIAIITPETVALAADRTWREKMIWMPQIVRLPSRGHLPKTVNVGGCRHYGFLGRFVDYKGIVELVDCWANMPEQAQLHVMGDGPLKQQILEQAKGDRRIVFHGSFSAAEKHTVLPAFCAQIDTLVIPTKTEGEGLPTVLIEALSQGVPVVATPTGGLRMFNRFPETEICDVISLVPVRDLQSYLINDAARPAPSRDIAMKCMTFATKHFDPDILADRWCKLCGI